jgi:hypothetical protein
MRLFNQLILLLLLVPGGRLQAAPPELTYKDLNPPPPRIIRVCCAFGSDLHLVGIPFIKINHITCIDQLGQHQYLGNNREGNGLIYTLNGGFIDIGHMRDVADWTAYLYVLILDNLGNEKAEIKLAYEGGKKILTLNLNSYLDSMDCLLLAGKIAYDLSYWHELSTWFGASAVPFLPERYSTLSVEDVYSNLLGVYIGIEAVKSDLPYNEAMTKLILSTLHSLNAVKTEDDTYAALESVRNIWWTNEKRLPSQDILIARDTETYIQCKPWLVPDLSYGNPDPKILIVNTTTSKGQLLTDYYTLSIDLNHKFPVEELFPERQTRLITQDDFRILLNRIALDLRNPDQTSYSHKEITPSGTDMSSF